MSNEATITVEHPGVFIQDELDARGWEQSDLAYILGMSVSQLNQIIHGKRSISVDLAVALGDAFDVTPEFFANLQRMYDLALAKKPDPGVKTRANWVGSFPVREMIRRGWIEDTQADLLDLQMMRFFDTNSVSNIPYVGSAHIAPHAAKKSNYDEITPVQLVWLHRVRSIAKTMDCPDYDKGKLIDMLPEIRAHMHDRDDFCRIPYLLWECGVRTAIVESLAGGKMDGVCTWLGDNPVIGLSLRQNRPDNLCFVIRHEIEHIINEDGKDVAYSHVDVFDPDRDSNSLPLEEQRADDEAAEFLLPQDKLLSFMSRKGKFISERDVLAFSARHHIHPSVVVGQIQFRRHQAGVPNAYAFLRKYQKSIEDCFMDWEFRDGWGRVAPVGL
ncbi:MAG: HigA family addiction module antitoxin [Aquisalinus sp.]|nr:HigA family addiction module antitoxin [Aquisalinus sp.]